jgi:S-formylglutathione hydrolase FrmB
MFWRKKKPLGTWHEETLGGHPCAIYEPREPNQHHYVVMYLHGVHLNRLVDNTHFVNEFEAYGLPVIAPMTQQSWWTDKICEEFDPKLTAERHILDNVLPHIEQHWNSRPPRIGLLGTSMGGQGALRFAYKYPDTFPVVAAISPASDYQLRIADGDAVLSKMYADREAARQDTALLHIHPLNWPRHQFFCCDPTDQRWYDSAERLRMKLHSLGIPFECEMEIKAGGHGFKYYNRMAKRAVGFIAERLERERLRLV